MWDSKLIDIERLRAFAAEADLSTLGGRCLALLGQQQATWPRLAQGVASLARIETKRVELNAWPVIVQFNPGRAASSLAKVDAASIAKRPCFLCAANSPPEQRGLRAGRYVLLTNPAPIVPGHLTIVHEEHVPQGIEAGLDAFLDLSRQLGDGWTMFYNGPRCGASAPDHQHFQAAPAGQMPIERDLDAGECIAELKRPHGTRVRLLADTRNEAERTRCVFVVDGGDPGEVAGAIRSIVAALPAGQGDGEPLLNLLCRHDGRGWTATLFPRAVHRPRCYFLEGDGRMLFSPGVMDMAGLVITVRAEDFARADHAVLAGVYREVSSSTAQCRAVMARL
ncbi:MAG TPA: DUF4922 domain-containing protein [Phycisphaerae bacterium]|nr:DUF4922 domain-containing protein [Phycisphaerae bacterium]